MGDMGKNDWPNWGPSQAMIRLTGKPFNDWTMCVWRVLRRRRTRIDLFGHDAGCSEIVHKSFSNAAAAVAATAIHLIHSCLMCFGVMVVLFVCASPLNWLFRNEKNIFLAIWFLSLRAIIPFRTLFHSLLTLLSLLSPLQLSLFRRDLFVYTNRVRTKSLVNLHILLKHDLLQFGMCFPLRNYRPASVWCVFACVAAAACRPHHRHHIRYSLHAIPSANWCLSSST